MSSFGIGELARRAGVNIDTVRYYEREGLVAPRERLASGYRRYGESELARLRFVRRAQALGFTLRDARELLELSSRRDVATVKRSAERKLQDVEQRLDDLRRMRQALKKMIAACPGHGSPEDCPILKSLGDAA